MFMDISGILLYALWDPKDPRYQWIFMDIHGFPSKQASIWPSRGCEQPVTFVGFYIPKDQAEHYIPYPWNPMDSMEIHWITSNSMEKPIFSRLSRGTEQ